jgi:hypothetical protein
LVLSNLVDRILNNINEFSAIGRSASGGKELMEKVFSKPHPLYICIFDPPLLSKERGSP